MARTIRADRIEREENTVALLLDIVSAVEVLAALHTDAANRRRCKIILEQVAALKDDALNRRNGQPLTHTDD
ncbi:MAG TPA: hypothetical protein VFU22_16535 [Roseiflexaceae bacterium]|nr:hypothetical protein [Roseiflexaceae bacterium]